MEEPFTYDDLLWDRMCDVIREAVGEDEWKDDGFNCLLASLAEDLAKWIKSDIHLKACMDSPIPRRHNVL